MPETCRLSRNQTFLPGPVILAVVLFLETACLKGADATNQINAPIGTHIYLQPSNFNGVASFSSNDRLVLTTYFYWYDVYSGAHLTDPDGTDALTDHPLTTTGFSYLSKAWHRGELSEMINAGIDVVLPVYWGDPSQIIPGRSAEGHPWSYAGIPPLIRAREELLAEGKSPPRIGLFYDTSTLQYNQANQRIDLTTPYGRQWFYESVRDFFSLIPPKHWAMIDGKPIVVLYSSAFAANHDQTCIDFLKTSFARDFGGRVPYVIREISWRVQSEQVYAWGGALGLKNPGVASLGPGYDHSAVPNRDPLVVPRENGNFFQRNWEAFLMRPSKLVMIETWNEYHEGTEIAATTEYGRAYIVLNRQYVDRFKLGRIVPGPYTGTNLLEINLGPTNRASGVAQFDWPDGMTGATNINGRDGRQLLPTIHGGRYVYFSVDNSFKWNETMELQVVVEFFEAAAGTLRLEYDGSDPEAPFQGAYTLAPEVVSLTGSRSWKRGVFTLGAALFRNSQNGGADFRLGSMAPGLVIGRVQVVRPGLRAEGFRPGAGFDLTIFHAPGGRVTLESSTNLFNWGILTNPLQADTAMRFLDPRAIQHRRRWYRLAPR